MEKKGTLSAIEKREICDIGEKEEKSKEDNRRQK